MLAAFERRPESSAKVHSSPYGSICTTSNALPTTSLGKSGQLFSPHYIDHWDAWYNNKTFPLAFTDAGVQATKMHELRQEPK